MKQLFLTTIIIACSLSANGQLPEWIIPAECETLEIKANNVVEGTVGKNHTLWNMEGKKLYSTGDKINDFSDDVATIQINKTNKFSGFVDTKGNFIELPDVEVAHDYPYFEDGFLVAKRAGNYVMYHKIGDEINLPVIQTLYPYSNGFATFYAYQQPEKKKNPYFNLLMSDGNPIKNFVIKENDKTKVIEPKDISFISTVGEDTWRALAVVKNKLYWFDTFEMYLIPIMIEDDDKKKQLVLESSKALSMTEFPNDSFTITAKYGKDKTIDFKFDNLLRLIPNNGKTTESKGPTKPFTLPTLSSTLTAYSEGNSQGLINAQNDTIPAQFEEIGIKYDNKAFAKMNGKWGVIEIIPDCDYSLSINDGEDILFRHRSANSMLRIDLPTRIKAENISIDVPESSGLHPDKTTRENKNTDNGNYIILTCTLDIPKELTDTVKEISYGPVTVIVDKVRLPLREVNANGWYMKNFTINIPDEEAIISNGKAVFDITINNEIDSEEKVYPFEVTLETDSLPSMTEKLSENSYRCTVAKLKNGVNDLTVNVSEKDCPSCLFPIEIIYSIKRKKETAIVRSKIEVANSNNEALIGSKEVEPNIIDTGKVNNILGVAVHEETKEVKPAITEIDRNTIKRITYPDGYFIGEIIADNVNFRSGPGINFPKSTYENEYMGKQEHESYPKGQRIKIKEEGDWYLVYDTPQISNEEKKDLRYISKNFIIPVESQSFSIDEISKPMIFFKVLEEDDEMGTKGCFADVIVIYPGGLFVEYLESFWDSAYFIGSFSDGDVAILYNYRFDGNYYTDRKNDSNDYFNIVRGSEGALMDIILPESAIKIFKHGNKTIKYPDLSIISEEKWRETLQKAKNSEFFNDYYNTIYNGDIVNIITKDELEKNYKKMN